MLRDRQRAIILSGENNVGTHLLDLIGAIQIPKLWTVGVLPKQRCCAIRCRMWLN